MELTEIVEQLEKCGFECEGGPLHMNVAFVALKEISTKKMRRHSKMEQNLKLDDNHVIIDKDIFYAMGGVDCGNRHSNIHI